MHAVVVGSNRGIGLEFCRQLSGRGDQVTALCRKASSELQNLGVSFYEGIDVGSDDVISVLQGLSLDPIDVLIHNAGISRQDSFENPSWESIRDQFEVNTLGPFRTVHALASKLNRPAQVVLITSRMGSVDDNSSGGSYGYRLSKAALNMLGVNLAHDLRERDVAVGLFHPGYVKTDMTQGRGNLEPSQAVDGILKGMTQLSLENTGGFWHSNGERLPW